VVKLSDAGLRQLHATTVIDELGNERELYLTGERPLTLYLDKREIVTLMTMGAQPELLILGYLRNQGLVEHLSDIITIQVDWDVNAVAVTTRKSSPNIEEKLSKRTVTSGCGQGTMFGNVMDSLNDVSLQCPRFDPSAIYAVLTAVTEYNQVYKQAGAVHGCALCTGNKVSLFVEDVGRHNAVDAISGWMWLNDVQGDNYVFYTTGRLTSEMVIKVAQMKIPLLLSRSGVTEMGLQIAKQIGLGMVARAKGKHFLIYNGQLQFDL